MTQIIYKDPVTGLFTQRDIDETDEVVEEKPKPVTKITPKIVTKVKE